MTRGEVAFKFTCLAHLVEVQGHIARIGQNDDHSPNPGDIDIALDSNYAHMVYPPPSRQTLHIEEYGNRSNDPTTGHRPGGCEDNDQASWDLPKVLDNGTLRDVAVGDHVSVLGCWVTDNHVHAGDGAGLEWNDGLDTVWIVKAELHPYYRKSIKLIQPLQPGEPLVQTLNICAPIFTANYRYHHGDDWQYVRQENVVTTVSTNWFFPFPTPPLGDFIPDVTHRAVLGEYIANNPENAQPYPARITVHDKQKESEGYRVLITLEGAPGKNPPLAPALFQAGYEVWWKSLLTATPVVDLVAFYASESIWLARLGGYDDPDDNVLDQFTHATWASHQAMASDVLAALNRKLDVQLQIQANRGGYDAAVNFAIDAIVRYAKYGGKRIADPNGGFFATDREVLRRLFVGHPLAFMSAYLRLAGTWLTPYVQNHIGFYEIFYTSESVVLAELGGYADPGSNNVDPTSHWDWMQLMEQKGMNGDYFLEYLEGKYQDQLNRLMSHSYDTAVHFYADLMVRFNALGLLDFGSAEDNSLDPAVHIAGLAGSENPLDDMGHNIHFAIGSLISVLDLR